MPGRKVDGYFRIDRLGGRHTLVAPDGEPFFALGVNHVDVVLDPEIRREHRPDDSEATILDEVERNLVDWGFNCLGYDAPEALRGRLPYFSGLQLTGNAHALSPERFHYDDVFCPEFKAKLEQQIAEVCARRCDDPMLIAYYMSDTPRWDLRIARERRGTDWVSFIRGLPADHPGKRAYVAFLAQRYPDFDDFIYAYRMPVNDIDELFDQDFRALELTHPKIAEDDELFLTEIAETHYADLGRFFKKHDPNHLLFSERFKMHDHTEGVIRAAGKHFDAIAVQPGPEVGPMPGEGTHESQWDAAYWSRLAEVSGKPTIVCDHQVSFHDPATPVTLWHQAGSQAEAGEAYARFAEAAAESPSILGYQRCQYVSRYDPTRRLTKQGLIDEGYRPHRELVGSIARANSMAKASEEARVRA